MRKGFTLVELAITATIVFIVASVSAPLVVTDRIAANEASAVTTLRLCASAQDVYKKLNLSARNDLLWVRQYSPRLAGLGGAHAHRDKRGEPLDLIPAQLADAGPGEAYRGYVYIEDTGFAGGDWLFDYSVFAYPVEYGVTGVHTYHISREGVVRRHDCGATPVTAMGRDGAAVADWETP